MGVSAFDTTIHGDTAEELNYRLENFENVIDEVVVRAIVADESLADYMALLSATAPRS
jgi:hypothetical protein